MAKITDTTNPELFANSDRRTQRNILLSVDAIVDAVRQTKEAEAAEKDLKAEFYTLAKAAYWEQNQQAEVPLHTFDATGKSEAVQVNFPNTYNLDKDKAVRIINLLGKTHPLAVHFQERTVVSVDVSSLNKQQEIDFYKELSALTKRYKLQGMVDDYYSVAPEFHDDRHSLTPAVNKAIDTILPMQVHVTTI